MSWFIRAFHDLSWLFMTYHYISWLNMIIHDFFFTFSWFFFMIYHYILWLTTAAYILFQQSLPGMTPQNTMTTSGGSSMRVARYRRRLQMLMRALYTIGGQAMTNSFCKQQELLKVWLRIKSESTKASQNNNFHIYHLFYLSLLPVFPRVSILFKIKPSKFSFTQLFSLVLYFWIAVNIFCRRDANVKYLYKYLSQSTSQQHFIKKHVSQF